MKERSRTHTTTNRTIFSSAELATHLPALIDPANCPPAALMPTFLHEATHHWCFTSSVGTALAVLEFRGRIAALMALDAATPDEAKALEAQAADDLTRAAVGEMLLRPLAEGMAAFAEFDLSVSNRSPVVPPPLRWAAMFSARDKMTGSPQTLVRRRIEIAQRTALELVDTRASPQMRRKKEALLIDPTLCIESDGYLLGYLTVKSLWQYFQRHHARFNEPEAFLLKVYETFYEDLKFVRLLLKQAPNMDLVVHELVEHIRRRFQYAFGEAKNTLAPFFDKLVAERTKLYSDAAAIGRVLPLADPSDTAPALRFRALWKLAVGIEMADLPENPANWSRVQSVMSAMNLVGHGRDLLHLGHLDVDLAVGPSSTFARYQDKSIAELPTVASAQPGIFAGKLHIILNTRRGEHIVAAETDRLQLVAIRQSDEAGKPETPMPAGAITGLIAGGTIADAFMFEDDGLSRLKVLQGVHQYVSKIRGQLHVLYGPWATPDLPGDIFEEVITKLMDSGIYGAFDCDGDMVRAVALIGCTAHAHWNPSFLQERFTAEGLEYEPLIRKLGEFARKTKLFNLYADGAYVKCTL